MTEDELLQEVQEIARVLGLFTFHQPDSRRSEKGWPDLAIIGTRVLFRELKSATGVLTSQQKQVGWKLKAAGQDWAVWWPKDLRNGNIADQLRGITIWPAYKEPPF